MKIAFDAKRITHNATGAIADGLVTGRVAGDAVVANTPVNLE